MKNNELLSLITEVALADKEGSFTEAAKNDFDALKKAKAFLKSLGFKKFEKYSGASDYMTTIAKSNPMPNPMPYVFDSITASAEFGFDEENFTIYLNVNWQWKHFGGGSNGLSTRLQSVDGKTWKKA